jgi:ribosome maturation factor RimP
MDRQETVLYLQDIIAGHLRAAGFELVELICRNEGRDLFLRVLADRPCGGITIEECSRLNNELESIMDTQGFLKERYILEVSSPGLDRPLRMRQDFFRCQGKEAEFFLNRPINSKTEWQGIISGVSDNAVSLWVKEQRLEIPIDAITKAKQIIDAR